MADLVVFKNKLPLTPMWYENKGKFLLYNYLCVIIFAHAACAQPIYTLHHQKKPFVINTYKGYKKSIKDESSKRIVPLKDYITPLLSDFKYATTNNFTRQVLYVQPVAYVRLSAAIGLKKVQEELALKGLGLKFFDAYRPYAVTKKMWNVVPDERYAANPAKGSGHNRGAAVDITLVKLSTGEELLMPTGFDDFSEKAHHNYMNLSAEIIENRRLLKTVMAKHGFAALDTEWWHYSILNAGRFELLDLSFKQLKKMENGQ